MAKIDLPKRYYRVPMLARRWECQEDDIHHLIEINLLKTVPMVAAYSGPEYTRLEVISYPDEETYRREIECLGEEYLDAVVIPAVPENDETQAQARERVLRWIDEEGYDKQVIAAYEVHRFESLINHKIQDESKGKSVVPRSSYLATAEMARILDGLNMWGYQQWKTKLSDPPAWIKPAMVSGGGPPNPNRWNPVELARILMSKNKVDLKGLNNRFKTDQRLQAWLSDWQCYAERIEDF